MHDLGDVFAGLVIGLIILGAWHVALKLNIDQNLSYRNSFLLLFGFQALIYLTYPSHQDHELSIWLLGVMTGWLLGSSQIELQLNKVNKLLVSSFSVFIVFFSMIFIDRIEDSIYLEGLLGFSFSYILGISFSLIVTWIIPRIWRLLNLAS